MNTDFDQFALDYQRIERAIEYVGENFKTQPELDDIAAHIGMSEFHFQRMFKRWVGISPKRYLQYVTKEYAKKLLMNSESILDVSYNSGLSGPGRLHDLFVSCEAVTPGEYKNRGADLQIDYGFHQTPFGECLLGLTRRGICGLYFVTRENRDFSLAILRKNWPRADFIKDQKSTQKLINLIFNPESWQRNNPFKLFIHGTNFQIKVWEALLRIPEGRIASYEEIAVNIGAPKAIRAVGSAIARNPISYLIPCHRVVRKVGEYGNYQGGPVRKRAIIAWEVAHMQSENE